MAKINFLLVFLVLIFGVSFSTILTNEIRTNFISDFVISKNCIIELEEFVDYNTGAKSSKVSSLLTLLISNSKVPKQKVILEQDISFIPPTQKITFNLKPTSTSGNYLSWDLGSMGVNQNQVITLHVPARVECDKFFKETSTFINYTKPKAFLQAPSTAKKGDFIEVTLKDFQNNSLKNVIISVIKPNQLKFDYFTNHEGKIRVLADQIGGYSYQVYEYEITPYITIVSESVPENLTSSIQKKQEENKQDFDFSLIFNFIGIIVILAAIVGAYYLFNYIRQSKEEEVYVPKAQSLEPKDSIAKEFREEYEQKLKKEESEQPMQEDEEEEDFDKKTAELLSKRKSQLLLEKKDKLEEVEENIKETERLPQEIQLDKESEEDIDETEIDEEAIQKTIAELEQLREELKQKQKSIDSLPPESAAFYEKKEPEKLETTKPKKERKKSKKVLQKDQETKSSEPSEEEDLEKQIEQFLLESERKIETKKDKKTSKKKSKKR